MIIKDMRRMSLLMGMWGFSFIGSVLPRYPEWRTMRLQLFFLFLNGALLFTGTVMYFLTSQTSYVWYLIPYALMLFFVHQWLQLSLIISEERENTLEQYLRQQRATSRAFADKQRRIHEFSM